MAQTTKSGTRIVTGDLDARLCNSSRRSRRAIVQSVRPFYLYHGAGYWFPCFCIEHDNFERFAFGVRRD